MKKRTPEQRAADKIALIRRLRVVIRRGEAIRHKDKQNGHN